MKKLLLGFLHLSASGWSIRPPRRIRRPRSNEPSQATSFYVANWNVENLYDTVDDPDNPGDDEFLPNNPTTRWTRVRYETKLDNLAQVIAGMNKGNGPDILGLEEVENEEVIRDLAGQAGAASPTASSTWIRPTPAASTRPCSSTASAFPCSNPTPTRSP